MFKKLIRKLSDSAILMSWSNQITIFLHGLIVTPFTLKFLSSADYSFWALQQTIVGMAMLADSGFGHTLQRSVSFFYQGAKQLPRTLDDFKKSNEVEGEPNIEKLTSLRATTFRVYLYLGILVLIVISIIGYFLLKNVISLSENPNILMIAYFLMILQALISIQNIKWSSFMTGLHMVARLNRYRTLINSLRTIVFLCVLFIYPDVVVFMSIMIVQTLISNVYFKTQVNKWYNKHSVHKKANNFDKDIFNSMWSSTWRLGLSQWGYFFTKHGTSILTAQLNNANLIAGFLFTQRILQFIRNLGESPITAHLPNYYSEMAVKNYSKVKKQLSQDMFITFSLLIGGFVGFGFLGGVLLDLLDISKDIVPPLIYTIMALTIVLDSYSWIHGTVYVSTNHVPFLIPTLITGAVIITGGFFVIDTFGLLGIVLVQFFANLAFNNWYAPVINLKLLRWPFLTHLHNLFIMGFPAFIHRVKEFKLK